MINLDEIKRRSLANLKFCKDFRLTKDKDKLIGEVFADLFIIEERANNCIDLIEALEKCKEALEFTLHCTKQLKWIVDGPGNITNPMFLGTGSVEGDEKVHREYLKAKQTFKEVFGEKK